MNDKWTTFPPALLKTLLHQIEAGTALNTALTEFITVIEQNVPYETFASVLLLNADGRLHRGAAPSLPTVYNDAIDGIQAGPNQGSCGTAAYCEHDIFVVDIETDERWVNYKTQALKHDLRSCWSVPIFGTNKGVLGTMAMYYRSNRCPTSAERELIHECARVASIIIECSRLQTGR